MDKLFHYLPKEADMNYINLNILYEIWIEYIKPLLVIVSSFILATLLGAVVLWPFFELHWIRIALERLANK